MYVVRKQRAWWLKGWTPGWDPKPIQGIMFDEEFGDSFALHLSFPSKFSTIFLWSSPSTNSSVRRAFLFYTMVSEEQEMPSGWPLGLEIMNTRLRVAESLQASAVEPHTLHMPSTSFSSFSSSNLDTESTASFFQDHSVPLGRLIGIRPGDGSGGLYFPNRMRFNERERASARGAHPPDPSRGHSMELSQGICIPLLLGILVKMNRSKSSSRHWRGVSVTDYKFDGGFRLQRQIKLLMRDQLCLCLYSADE